MLPLKNNYDMMFSYENIITMSTLSVPLSTDLRARIKYYVSQGDAPNEAALARKAIQKYLEEKAVEDVLNAQKEPSLCGNLDDLAQKL